ncbi:LamG domain-containing protein [Pedobacter frigiditerrae]|uniref:LamG domain-containing protein n=1 Tax=Pedobacter frigiditerrae TaxID=2530452 RepID=A0A4R0N584_9SPHI|nr:LamG-like jellyroll fold domain-containing protein [Pedobacter frigiditerrae]TCC94503.1 LamG domain-containing protein [Pedobacter frigiditerrae]
MKFSNLYTKGWLLGLTLATATFSSCKKDGNPNNLPEIDASNYAGKIDGFSSSDEVYPKNLVAYWSFDGTKNEIKSATAPTSTSNDTFIPSGVKGQALSLNAGYLYYGTQFNAVKTAALKSFTLSEWVQISNNGSKKTMLFQIARPGLFNGSFDFILETNANPATNTDYIQIHPYFTTLGGGRQDNINNFGATNLSPKIGANKWVHFVITYDGTSGIFDIWANAIKVGNYPSRGTGNNVFNSFEPSEIIMGGVYNLIPGKSVSTDTSFGAMTGSIDEVRLYNTPLPQAYISALYNLGLAGK